MYIHKTIIYIGRFSVFWCWWIWTRTLTRPFVTRLGLRLKQLWTRTRLGLGLGGFDNITGNSRPNNNNYRNNNNTFKATMYLIKYACACWHGSFIYIAWRVCHYDAINYVFYLLAQLSRRNAVSLHCAFYKGVRCNFHYAGILLNFDYSLLPSILRITFYS